MTSDELREYLSDPQIQEWLVVNHHEVIKELLEEKDSWLEEIMESLRR